MSAAYPAVMDARRDRLLDAALGALTAGLIGAAVTANVRGDGTPPVAYLFAVGFGALMLVRRAYPVLTLVASGIGLLGYYALGLPPIGLALPVGAALYSAAEAGRLRWAFGTAAALVIVSSVARTAGGEDSGYLYAYELPTTVAVMAAAIVFGDGVRTRRLWRAEVAARLAREADRRVQSERVALARDLHDVLAHTVSVVTLHADVAAEAIEDGDTLAARLAVGRVREASGGAARELRGTMAALRGESGVEPPIGMLARLDDLTANAPVALTIEGEARPLPRVVDATAYRIVQEALTNARRHAPGSPVTLTMSYHPTELALRITNNTPAAPVTRAARRAAPLAEGTRRGKPMSAERPATVTEDGPAAITAADDGPAAVTAEAGHGLRGMRERASLLGGSLRAGPGPDGTFVVEAALPAEPAP